MNAEIKAKWVAALRGGQYKQGKGLLKRGDEFCCLGVLTDLFLAEHSQKYSWGDFSHLAYLPPAARDWAGLKRVCPTFHANGEPTLQEPGEPGPSELNDFGRSFQQIADLIESSPL